ncbi:hypothetical protein Vadar_020498 [Vaccinium darrowii]|uniref:Uncharacterized protein n=1 Tax=Vaccinium darrowii TaxID=229202 RepID=A0ACB7X2S6_9ERIC|nr:hypothetical protein Vadar_020498 [Vaccinium darrowii]
MGTAGGQIGEPEVVELAISMLCPSIDDGGGSGDQPKNKCVCVIGSNVNRFPDLEGEEEEEKDSSKGTGRWWVQFFIGDGYSMSSIMDIASSGVALDFESISVDRTGIMAVHKPFKQVKMDVDLAPDGSPTIYCLGGFVRKEGPWEEYLPEYLLSRDVRIFDFNTATITYCPSMEAPRVRSVVLVLDGKIYVFGGVTYDNPAVSWAESLEIITTNSNTDAHPWKLLHPLPCFLAVTAHSP